MERPFDYAGKSEPDGFEPHHLTRSNSAGIHHQYDDFGGHAYVVSVWFAPDWWSDDEVARAVAYQLEPEHCTHAHDCCGQYYSRGGRVLSVSDGHRDENGERCRLVIVGTSYVQNV